MTTIVCLSLRFLVNLSITVNDQNFIGKSFNACLQLDLLNECRKGLLPTLVCIYEIHSTHDFRQPTYGKHREKSYMSEKRANLNLQKMFSINCMNMCLKGCFFLSIQHTKIQQLPTLTLICLCALEVDKRNKCAQFSSEDRKLLWHTPLKRALMQLSYGSKARRISKCNLTTVPFYKITFFLQDTNFW